MSFSDKHTLHKAISVKSFCVQVKAFYKKAQHKFAGKNVYNETSSGQIASLAVSKGKKVHLPATLKLTNKNEQVFKVLT